MGLKRKTPRLPWIFVDGTTQQTFRIRLDIPAWNPPAEGDDQDEAQCAYYVTADDGGVFALRLQISGEVLDDNEVRDLAALLTLVQSKGVEIIEGAIHNGIRGDHQLVWDPDGVSVVR
jgi:hypothetical protein